jgi:hypothetical protein
MDKKDTPAAPVAGTFVNIVTALDRGAVIADLDDLMREATRSAQNAASKSKVTLELTIIPNGTGAGDTPLFKVEAKCKITAPQTSRQPSNFFVDDDGNLSRRNPRQDEIKFEARDGGKITKEDIKAQAANDK